MTWSVSGVANWAGPSLATAHAVDPVGGVLDVVTGHEAHVVAVGGAHQHPVRVPADGLPRLLADDRDGLPGVHLRLDAGAVGHAGVHAAAGRAGRVVPDVDAVGPDAV